MALTNLAPSIANNPNLTALANAFDACVSHSTQTLMPMLVEACPSDYLPYLAQNFSLTDEPNWQVAQDSVSKAKAIQQSLTLHRIKGTPQAVKTLLSDANLAATLTEPKDKPNHYQVTIQAKSVARDQSLSNTRSLITQVAPASSVPLFKLEDNSLIIKNMAAISVAILKDTAKDYRSINAKLTHKMGCLTQVAQPQQQGATLKTFTPIHSGLFAQLRKVS